MPSRGALTEVTLEVVEKKVFASATGWPGWARSGRTEEAALDVLADYAPRYAEMAALAGVKFPAAHTFTVIERVAGDGSTSFGVPGVVTDADTRPLTPAQAATRVKLLRGAWQYLADVVRDAPPTLRRGPRGGGRDRDEVLRHVLAAESGYARQIGLKFPEPTSLDDAAPLHEAMAEALSGRSDGSPIGRKWTPRYACHRVVWHVLDHAWEIQDKSQP